MAFFDKLTKDHLRRTNVPFRDFNPNNQLTIGQFIIHLLIVMGFILMEMSPAIFGAPPVDYWNFISFYIFDIIFFFLMFYFYFPIILNNYQRPAFRIFAGAGAILGYSLVVHLYDSILKYFKSGLFEFHMNWSSFLLGAARGMLISLIAYLLSNNKYVQKVEAENRERRTRELELKNDYLRAQLDPHLINNVLTVLYGRILEYSTVDAEIIRLLSVLTSHAITRSDPKGYISIQSEITNIKNYIKIMELCKESAYEVKWNVEESHLEGISLPPNLLLEPVINLLKYGLNSWEYPIEIELLFPKTGILSFRTFNHKAAPGEFEHSSHTVGLTNLQERLLINYPGMHELDIRDTESTFELTLIIKL
ncbi:histidine kinase [Sphingobacterium faecium]|uniref:histidine kinase n=1 Tax=Sphingobacterium faecium TaxID=34087 RepID=UPI00320814EF